LLPYQLDTKDEGPRAKWKIIKDLAVNNELSEIASDLKPAVTFSPSKFVFMNNFSHKPDIRKHEV